MNPNGRKITRQNSAGEWRCYYCKKYKPIHKFWICKTRNGRLIKRIRPQSNCKDCDKQRYHQRNKDIEQKGFKY